MFVSIGQWSVQVSNVFIMSITPYTVISIENLLFGSDNLTDENNLTVFRIYLINRSNGKNKGGDKGIECK
jgi:hypothetical protein